MNLLTSLIVLFFPWVIASTGTISKPIILQSRTQKYVASVANPKAPRSCTTLKNLSEDKKFNLQQLAKLRYSENCLTKVDWAKLQKEITKPVLKPFILNAQYNYEIKKKRFGNAYRIFNKNRKHIKVDKKDFDHLATKALKTRLTRKEKTQLRKELRKRSPRFLPRPNKKQFLKVAKDYRKVRNFEKALYYYRKVINDSKSSYHQRWHAYKGARITYKLERWARMKKYILSSKQWASFLKTKYKWSKELTRLHHDANIEYIRTLWTEKGQTQAKPVLKRLEKDLKNRYSLQLVYWLKGRMAEESKDYKMAVHWLIKSSKEKDLSARDRQRVLWALAWNERRIKDYKGSQQTLEKLKKSPELTFFAKTKYLYWQAENIQSQGQKDKAQKAFKRLAEFDAYGYYGALSYRKLGIPFPQPPKFKFNKSDVLSFFKTEDGLFLSDLVKVQEFEIAESFTRNHVKTKRSWSTTKWVNYLKLLQFVGAYKTFFYRYHTLPPKKQLAVLEEHPYLLFPQPYKDQVLTSAKKTQVSPALIYSIMKQESGFDVKARSHADAFGLLQLIPQVAKKAAKRMPSIAYDSPYDLYKPNVIIPLGANNLHHLFAKFKSNFILSVASYNASEKAVRGWVQNRYNKDPVTFIEDIPYEETKGYVKLVMRNYITYNRFDSSEEVFNFPEVCLQGLQAFRK